MKNRKIRSLCRKYRQRSLYYIDVDYLYGYHDKNGICISAKEIGRIPGMQVYIVDTNTLNSKWIFIDYCTPECVWYIYDAFKFLTNLGNRTKVARRWLRRLIINLEFGDTKKYVKDYILPNGDIDIERVDEELRLLIEEDYKSKIVK